MPIIDYVCMQHPQHIFSLPPSIQVSHEQLQTTDRRIQIASQTRLAFLNEAWLNRGAAICNGVGIAAGGLAALTGYAGVVLISERAMHLFYKMLPPFFIGSMIVVICLIGRHVFRLEQKERFKRECLEFEHELIEWKNSFITFKEALKNFQDNRSVDNLIFMEQEVEALKRKIVTIDIRLAYMAKRLKKQHENLFGSTRTFNNGSECTIVWTDCLHNELLSSEFFYGRLHINKMPDMFQSIRRDGSVQNLVSSSTEGLTPEQRKNVVSFNFALKRAYNNFFPHSPNSASPDEWLERARASLAAFRSTLDW